MIGSKAHEKALAEHALEVLKRQKKQYESGPMTDADWQKMLEELVALMDGIEKFEESKE